MRGGNLNSSFSDVFMTAGQAGLLWSSQADSSNDRAYGLKLDSANVDPSYNVGDWYYGNRYYGYSLRCLISTP